MPRKYINYMTETQGLHRIMCDEEDCFALQHPGREFLQAEFGNGIKGRKGFIHQNDRRSLHQGACESDPLAHAAWTRCRDVRSAISLDRPDGGGLPRVQHSVYPHVGDCRSGGYRAPMTRAAASPADPCRIADRREVSRRSLLSGCCREGE